MFAVFSVLRSPSPEPIYDHNGKRLNTREYRTRKKLEEERHIAVQEALTVNPEYKPPADYKCVQQGFSVFFMYLTCDDFGLIAMGQGGRVLCVSL